MVIGISPGYYWTSREKYWSCYIRRNWNYYPRNSRNYNLHPYADGNVYCQSGYTFQDTVQAVSTNENVLKILSVDRESDRMWHITFGIMGDGQCNIIVTSDGFTEIKPVTVTNSFIAYPFTTGSDAEITQTLQNFKHSSFSIDSMWAVGDTRIIPMSSWNYEQRDGTFSYNQAQNLTARIELIQRNVFAPVSEDEQTQVIISFTQESSEKTLKCTWHGNATGEGWKQSYIRGRLNNEMKNSLQTQLPIKQVYVKSFCPKYPDEGRYVQCQDYLFLPALGQYCNYNQMKWSGSNVHYDGGDVSSGRTFMRGKNGGILSNTWMWTRTASNRDISSVCGCYWHTWTTSPTTRQESNQWPTYYDFSIQPLAVL